MDNTRKFHATITTRYGLPEKDIYEQVIDLVKKENIARSRAQLLLVKRGLQHTHNPGPLVKEEKKQIGGSDPGQRASGDMLTTQNKADPPHTVLEEKKSPSDTTRETLNWVGWLGLSGVIGYLAYRVYQVYYLGRP